MAKIYSMDRVKEIRKTLKLILEDATEYWSVYNEPVPFRAISRRYSKRCRHLDTTFRDLIEALTKTGKLTVSMDEEMRRYIWLPGTEPEAS